MIPANRHGVYPKSLQGGRAVLHAPAYVAATWDGQLSVSALCGAVTFRVVASDHSRAPTQDESCPNCLALLVLDQETEWTSVDYG